MAVKRTIFYEAVKLGMAFVAWFLIVSLLSVWDVVISGNNPVCGSTACAVMNRFNYSWIDYRLGWDKAIIVFIISYLVVLFYNQIINKKNASG